MHHGGSRLLVGLRALWARRVAPGCRAPAVFQAPGERGDVTMCKSPASIRGALSLTTQG